MADTKKQKVRDRRKLVLSALQECGAPKATKQGHHLREIYEGMRKKAGIRVGEQTIKGDLEYLSRKRPLWGGDRGKVKKIKGKLEWLYVKPKPPSFAAYGYRWKRDSENWNEEKLEGKKKGKNAKHVDFSGRAGVYLLHNGDRTVYVGRVQGKERDIKTRLNEHRQDRLKHDWDKFSWFVFNKVQGEDSESGSEYFPPLIKTEDADETKDQLLQVITMIEAVIINGIRPSRNSRGGDVRDDVLYDQVVDSSKK